MASAELIIYDAQNPDVGLYVVIVGRVNQLVDEMIFLQKTGSHLSHREAIFRSRQRDKPCVKHHAVQKTPVICTLVGLLPLKPLTPAERIPWLWVRH
jgi:hypothetical protein